MIIARHHRIVELIVKDVIKIPSLVLYSLINPHSIGYSPTGLDLGVLGCAGLLDSGGLYWALVGRVGLGYAVLYAVLLLGLEMFM